MANTNAIRTLARWCVILPVVTAVACGDQSRNSALPEAETTNAAAAIQPDARSRVRLDVTDEQADLGFRAMVAIEKEIPRDTFDPKAIVQAVGSDPLKLFEWVRDNTYWVPYRGALRGPVGVLMDRTGNSLDRSLLLAELLRTAGHEVQLARGSIAADQIDDLLKHLPVRPEPVKGPGTSSSTDIAAEAARLANEFRLDKSRLIQTANNARTEIERMMAEMNQRLAIQPEFLIDAVGTKAARSDSRVVLASAIGDHWWVKTRSSAEWIDFDPLFPGAQPARALAHAIETYPYDKPAGQVPLRGEFVQEVSIRVVVERWKEGQLTEGVALEYAFRPAEKIGQAMFLQNVPVGWSLDASLLREKQATQAFKDQVLMQSEWLPTLMMGGRSLSQFSVDEAGELKSASTRPLGDPGGVADTLAGSESFGGDQEGAQQESYFTAEWIEYEIRVPGEEPRKIRREVFDVMPAGARSADTVAEPVPSHERRLGRALGLIGSVHILALASQLSPEFVASRMIHESLNNREAVSRLRQKLNAGDIDATIDEIGRALPTTERLFNLSLARFAWSKVRDDIYLHAPNILTYRTNVFQDLRGELSTRQGFDIVVNAVEADPRAQSSPFSIRVSQGVVDTNAEALLVSGNAGNAGSILKIDARHESWITIREASDLHASGIVWPPDIRARISESISDGYVVVVPSTARVVAGKEQWAWWQINPATGETLGIGRQGWGSATAETSISQSEAIFVASWAGFVTGALVTIGCLIKKQLLGDIDVLGPPDPARERQAMADCACAGLDAGANVTGILISGIVGLQAVRWLAKSAITVTRAALIVGATQGGKELICG